MIFTLELPPPINQTYGAVHSTRLNRTVFFKNYAAKKWQKQAQKTIISQLKVKGLIEGKVHMHIGWVLKRDRDIDSGLKLLFDVFEGIVFNNDRQIIALSVSKREVAVGEIAHANVEITEI